MSADAVLETRARIATDHDIEIRIPKEQCYSPTVGINDVLPDRGSMPQKIEDLLEKLNHAVELYDSPERTTFAARTPSGAEPYPFRLPLIHRTGDIGKGDVKSILRDGELRPPSQPSREELDLGLEPAVYFFYGADAYDMGSVAFVYFPETEELYPSDFSPFDSGAIASPPRLTSGVHGPGWEDSMVRQSFLREHTGAGTDLNEFAFKYVVAHFRVIQDYVKRSQEAPDWPVYHGLECLEALDRRAWTIEVRVQKGIPIKEAQAIVVDEAKVHVYKFPDECARLIVLVEPSQALEEVIADYVMQHYF